MVVHLRCAKIPKIGSIKPVKVDEALHNSPFRHDPTLRNRPILLSSFADYRELSDDDDEVVSHLKPDTTDGLSPTDELWFAHIATLHDEMYDGPDPLNRMNYALEVDGVATFPLNRASKHTSDSAILAHCLILKSMGTQKDTYPRLGIAELKYGCIIQISSTLMTLV